MEYTASTQTSVIQILRELYPESSRRTLQNWLKAGRFSVNGKPVTKETDLVQTGEILSSQTTFRPPRIPGMAVIYEDRYLIAIDKPVGLLSTPLDDGDSERHALGVLRQHYESDQIFAVHRIDRETSGLLLFARGKQSAERLNELFEQHDLKREYFAIVEGRMKDNQGTWECPLLELPNFNVIESADGKMAITHFEVIRRSTKYTYVKLTLETGKKHQIRVHCKRAGHPVVGDRRYSAKDNPLHRLCLHAWSLELVHPFTKKKLSLKSPLPKSFLVLGASKGGFHPE